MIGPEPDPRAWRGLHLLDLSALIVGYGLAAVLVRAFWPSAGIPTTAIMVVVSLEYLWLGLAMSGPLVLARRRWDDPRGDPYTRAEAAWMVIGGYWIGMTVLTAPILPHPGRMIDAALLGAFPLLAAFVVRALSSRRQYPARWTHRAALGLLVTWPVAWAALILLGKTLL